MANTVVSDANGVELGKAVFMDENSITLITSKGYMCKMKWDGSLVNSTMFFSGSNGSGTVYTEIQPLEKRYGRTVFWNSVLNKLLVPKDINSDGTPALATGTICHYSETYGGAGAISATYNSGCGPYQHIIELLETTRSAVGLPDTIVLPLAIQFK